MPKFKSMPARAWLLAAAAGCLLSPAALAATLSVPSQFPTIQAAIDAAVDSDVIVVAPGTYAEAIDFGGRNITLRSANGAGVTTIDGSGFSASTVTVTNAVIGASIEGFTIIAGEGTDFLVDDEDPTLGSVTYGGSLFTTDTFLTVSDSVIRDGATTGSGGGAALFTASNVQFTNVEFINNSTDDTGTNGVNVGRGGAVSVSSTSFADFDSCTFTGNSASNSGGAINAGGTVTINDSVFTDNEAAGSGGAVFVLTGNVTVDDSTFTNNRSVRGGAFHFNRDGVGVVRGSTFEGNTTPGSGSRGAAIYAIATNFSDPDAEALFENCTFIANDAGGSNGRGGALYATSSSSGPGVIRVVGSTIDNHSATQRGAAGYISGGVLTIEDTTVTNSTSDQRGGAFYVASGGVFNIVASTIDASTAGERGGAIYLFRGEVNITDSVFSNNSGLTGGAIDARSSGSGGAFLNIVNSEFVGNTASEFGGAIGFAGSTSVLNADRMIVRDNEATFFDSGAITITNSVANISNSLIADNRTNDFLGGSALLISSGSGIANLVNCTIVGNRNITADSAIDGAGEVNITNCIIWDNDGFDSVSPFLFSNVSYSIIEGGMSGPGVLDVNPQFSDAAAGDFTLASNSPAIDAGDNFAAEGFTLDLAGNTRFVDDPDTADTGVGTAPIIDIGAYEFQVGAPAPCPFDITGPALDGIPDGLVTIADLNFYISLWLAGDIAADFTGPALDGIPDGAVTIADLNFFLDGWLNSQGACN
ncbi:MAG: hypothetical protein EA378_05660 [Phycisphaerales bacterium]|nr:MAG: hypothetical protein EA378_05660 [Phycisphaerales bacterium]